MVLGVVPPLLIRIAGACGILYFCYILGLVTSVSYFSFFPKPLLSSAIYLFWVLDSFFFFFWSIFSCFPVSIRDCGLRLFEPIVFRINFLHWFTYFSFLIASYWMWWPYIVMVTLYQPGSAHVLFLSKHTVIVADAQSYYYISFCMWIYTVDWKSIPLTGRRTSLKWIKQSLLLL